jgi:predicted nuclease of predicted toxin-antitoxin system
MKILLDECVPIQLRNAFLNHEVHSATTPNWKGLSNGQLLDRAELEGFDLVIVADKNMRHQQDLSTRRIAILELWTNHRPTLELHFDYIRAAAERIASSEYVQLRQP